MSTPPIHHRPVVPVDHVERLSAVADVLADMAEAAPGPPELVGVVDLAGLGVELDPAEQPDALTLTHLDGPDPVGRLLGLTALDEWWAVGLVAPAAGAADHVPADPLVGALVHLVARDGTALTTLAGQPLAGPTTEPQAGRVPDLCRRVLGLPTAPPPGGLGPHFVDLWLVRLVHAALATAPLGWPEAARLHPATAWVGLPGFAPSPAELVRATAEVDDPQLWETYLSVCRAGARTPWDCLDPEALTWLDTGSFARWLLGEAAPQPFLLEHLDAVLPRDTADKVFATVRLSPAPAWPPAV